MIRVPTLLSLPSQKDSSGQPLGISAPVPMVEFKAAHGARKPGLYL